MKEKKSLADEKPYYFSCLNGTDILYTTSHLAVGNELWEITWDSNKLGFCSVIISNAYSSFNFSEAYIWSSSLISFFLYKCLLSKLPDLQVPSSKYASNGNKASRK